MALERRASSPMNFVLMRLEIQPSAITSPVLLTAALVFSAPCFDFSATVPAVPLTLG